MKTLIFTDLHIHKHKDRIDRLNDCLKVLNWVFDTAIKKNCKCIFFLGDLFHDQTKIDVLIYLRTFEVLFKRLTEDAKGIDFYILVGNHDMYHKERWDVNSVKPLSAIPGIHIIENPQTLLIADKTIHWMPHTHNPIGALEDLKGSGKGDILFAHLAVHGAFMNTFYGTHADVIVEHDNEMCLVDVKIFDDWDMTFLGHYHGAQKLSPKVEYVGSPLQLSFGEAFQSKHIIVLDLETMKKEYIENTFSPKHLIITPDDIEKEHYDLNGQFIRISVDNMSRKDLIDIKRKVHQESKPLSLDVKKNDNKKSDEDTNMINHIQFTLQDPKNMILQYIEEVGIPEGLDKDHLIAIGVKCLETNT